MISLITTKKFYDTTVERPRPVGERFTAPPARAKQLIAAGLAGKPRKPAEVSAPEPPAAEPPPVEHVKEDTGEIEGAGGRMYTDAAHMARSGRKADLVAALGAAGALGDLSMSNTRDELEGAWREASGLEAKHPPAEATAEASEGDEDAADEATDAEQGGADANASS